MEFFIKILIILAVVEIKGSFGLLRKFFDFFFVNKLLQEIWNI